ncbi:MAG: hypothetical protein ABI616_06705 [Pseudomonadota bacterium]
MSQIELPRAVEAYFAFAELPATLQGRRFTITFTYMEGGRLDRLQWWWQLSTAQERSDGLAAHTQRQEAVERFRKHIESWLMNSQRRLTGGDPFPQLEPAVAPRVAEPTYSETELAYARMTAGR